MSNLWKEQFDKEIAFEEYGDRSCIFCGHDHYAGLEGGNELVKDFISTQIIEKIIDDIPDAEIDEYSGDSVSLLELKQQLKDKWLI